MENTSYKFDDEREPLPNNYVLLVNNGLNSYQIEKQISYGGSCLVYQAICDGRKYIVKEFYPKGLAKFIHRDSNKTLLSSRPELFEKQLTRFKDGIENYKYFLENDDELGGYCAQCPNDPFLAKNKNTYVVIPYVKSAVTLAERIEEGKANGNYLSLEEIARIMYSVAKISTLFHKRNLLYLDFKPDNLFLDKSLQVKLFDFDSVVSKDAINGFSYTFSDVWSAPEQQIATGISEKSDTYAVGMIFLYLLDRKRDLKSFISDVYENRIDKEKVFEWIENKETYNQVREIVLESTAISPSNRLDDQGLLREFKNLKNTQGACKGDDGIITNRDAERYQGRFTERFDFSYDKETPSIGRSKEKVILENFCDAKEKLLWTAISGASGSGKTKLAYDIAEHIGKREDWVVIYPESYRFIDTSKSITKNTLICIDDVEASFYSAMEFIKKMAHVTLAYKVRILLIDRNIDKLWNSYRSTDVAKYQYGSILHLDKLKDRFLIDICKNYAIKKPYEIELTENQINTIINKLKELNDDCAPLFLLILTDSVCRNVSIDQWDFEAAINWYVHKELARIDEYIFSKSDPVKAELIRTIIRYLLLKACFQGETKIETIYTKDVSDEYLRVILNNLGLIEDNKIKRIKPDLIGEYFCVNIFSYLEEESDDNRIIDKFFEDSYNSAFIKEVVSYQRKIFDDYESVIRNEDAKWMRKFETMDYYPSEASSIPEGLFEGANYLKNAVIPEGVIEIQDRAFKNCKNLFRIQLPETIMSIGFESFYNCSLKEVCLDGDPFLFDLKDIEERAFANNTSLEFFNATNESKCNFPSTITQVYETAFENCPKLELPKHIEKIHVGTRTIGNFTFDYHIETLIVPENTELTSGSFSGLSYLKKITFEGYIESLPSHLFAGSYNLKTIIFEGNHCEKNTVPDSINKIEKCVFSDLEQLEEIYFPKNIDISEHAFEFSGLKKFKFAGCAEENVIPEYVNVDSSAFYGCDNLVIKSKYGIDKSYSTASYVFYDDVPKIISFAKYHRLVEFKFGDYPANTIPKGCILSEEAFLGTNIREIFFQEAITIPARAFKNCLALEHICFSGFKLDVVPFDVEIGEDAFYGCDKLILSRQEQPNTVAISSIEDVKSMEIATKMGMKRFTFSNNQEVNHVPSGAMISLCLPYGCFADCKSLEEVRISAQIKCFPPRIFYNCLNLNNFRVGEETNLVPEGTESIEWSFTNSNVDGVILPSSLKEISPYAFKGCRRLRTFRFINTDEDNTLPESVELGELCFADSSIERIQFSSLTVIPRAAFSGSNIREFRFPGHKVNEIPSYVNVSDSAFLGCQKLKVITLPLDMAFNNVDSYLGCNFEKISFYCDDMEPFPQYMAEKYMIFQSQFSSARVIDLTATKIEELPEYAFESFINLEEIYFPESLKTIGDSCFRGCSKLRKVKGGHIEHIGSDAFYNSGLEEINIPETVSEIGEEAFANCQRLRTVSISQDIKYGPGVFRGSSIEEVTISANHLELARDMFRECRSLSKFIAISVCNIPDYCFYRCYSLDQFVLKHPEILEGVGSHSFESCKSLGLDFSTYTSLKFICSFAFHGCVALKEVKQPSIRFIGDSGFKQCTGICRVETGLINSIEKYAFAGCKNLRDVTMKNVVGLIDDYAFYFCISLEKIEISSTLTTIGKKAFGKDRNLIGIFGLKENANKKKDKLTIKEGAFSQCNKFLTRAEIRNYCNCEDGVFD